MKTAAELRELGNEAMREAETTLHWPSLWRQTACTWFALARLAEQRERDVELAAAARWWKPWTWCGKPATVRAHRLPYWSEKFCPEHAADFNEAKP